MNIRSLLVVLIILTAFAFSAQAGAADKSGAEELAQEMKEIKRELSQIKNELKAIKTLVQQRPAKRPPAPKRAKANIKDDPSMGSPDAKLVLVEYTDYQCPFCSRHSKNTLPQIKKEFIDKGKLRYVLKDFPLPSHRQARDGAEAAHCAGEEGKYWEMHDLLFANTRQMSLEDLEGHGEGLGLNMKKFKACLADDRYIKGIEGDVAEGRKGGVTGTPSFLLGTVTGDGVVEGVVIKGARSYASFKSEIEAQLKRKTAAKKK